jgi:hypothetical protein
MAVTENDTTAKESVIDEPNATCQSRQEGLVRTVGDINRFILEIGWKANVSSYLLRLWPWQQNGRVVKFRVYRRPVGSTPFGLLISKPGKVENMSDASPIEPCAITRCKNHVSMCVREKGRERQTDR